MALAVVVVHFNAPLRALRAVESLVNGTLPVQVIIVDNASTSENVHVLQSKLGGKATVVRSDTNLGFAGGANLGVHYALRSRLPRLTDFIAVAAHDIVVAPDTLDRMARVARSDPAIGIVAPRYHDIGDESDLPNAVLTTREQPAAPDETLLDDDWAPGALLLFRVGCFAEVGGFDERLFCYYEDVDICARARVRGWRVVLVEGALAFGTGHDIDNSLHRFLIVRNRLLVAMRPGRRRAAVGVVISCVVDLLRCLVGAALPTRTHAARSDSRNAGWATWRGLVAGLTGVDGPPKRVASR